MRSLALTVGGVVVPSVLAALACGGNGKADQDVAAPEPCGQTIAAYCANQPCIQKVPPKGGEGLKWQIIDAYCADSTLRMCISGAASCGLPDVGGPGYVDIELAGCGQYDAFYDATTGELVAVYDIHDHFRCVAGINLGGLRCMGTGIHCVTDAGTDPDADADADGSAASAADSM